MLLRSNKTLTPEEFAEMCQRQQKRAAAAAVPWAAMQPTRTDWGETPAPPDLFPRKPNAAILALLT